MTSALLKTLTLAETTFRKAFKPKEKLNIWEWSERHITLPKTFSSMPGRYDANYTPFWKPVFEAVTDTKVRRVTILKSVQIGGTQVNLNSLLYAAENMGVPIMYVGQTEDDVKEFVSTKLKPLIQSTLPVFEIAPRESKMKLTSIHFSTVPLYIGWGSSVSKLASKNVGFLLLDEVDKYEHKVKKETHPFNLALRRCDAFKGREKIVITSTPTDQAGKIYESYLEGSQSVFHFKCPSCSFEQPFEFNRDRLIWDKSAKKENGKWDLKKVEETAAYSCVKCGVSITQDLKPKLIKEGRFIATNEDAPDDHLSFHINKFISPLPNSWGIIARSFLERKSSPDGLRDFYTQDLGLPFVEEAFANDEKTIEELLENSVEYYRGQIPFHAKYKVLSIDVQQKSFWWMKSAWSEDGDCAIVDWGEAYSWKGLEALMKQEHECLADDLKHYFTSGVVDSGYEAKQVYEYCWKSNGRLHPSKGEGRRLPNDLVEVKKMTYKKRRMYLYRYEDYAMKKWVLRDRLQGKDESGGIIMVPRDYNVMREGEKPEDGLAEQLIDERMVETVKGGKTVMEFQSVDKHRANNHLADCLKESHVVYYTVSPHADKGENQESEEGEKTT